MNPLYKYPLLVVFFLVIVGLGYWVFRNLPEAEMAAGEDGLGRSPTAEQEVIRPTIGSPPAAGRDARGLATGSQEAPPAGATALLDSARAKYGQADLLGARRAAEAALAQPGVVLFGRAWNDAARLISQVNTELFNSDAPAPEKQRYEVKPGDNLVRIARAHNTTVEALIRGNKNLDNSSATIFPGMVFSIYKGDWRIVVHKSRFVLLVYDGERLFKLYDVAIGKQGRTPAGTFMVKDKLREPAWTPPGKHIAYGDPENVLGTRWLGLVATGDTDPSLRGYGIHGTWEPNSIGSAASEGCIRLRNEDVNELFDLVPVNTPVTIKED